jgi:tricorn protease
VSSHPGDAKSKRRVEIQAVGREKTRELMYERWVERNARRVAELSKGKLGYIHIPSMDEKGLDGFVRSLYSDNFDKEAIVLDVRYNGGGYTHDQVLSYLGGRDHTYFRQRNGGQGMVMRSFDRKWTKPVVLLINNRSYSDAEIFPSAFRTLGLGKLVGQPTVAHVIGTYTVRLIDGSHFRIPRVGVFTPAGANMEKQGVMPDILVNQLPDQLARGIDPQLDKAVEVVQQDVVAWKKTHSGPELSTEQKGAASVPTASRK